MKKIIIIVILIVFLFGGGYWYAGIYQPAQFGEGFVAFYKKFQSSGDIMNFSAIKNDRDFAGALDILIKRKQALTEQRDELMAIRPPLLNGEMKDVRATFSMFFEQYLAANSEAESRAVFLANAMELLGVFDPIRSIGKPPQNVGDYVLLIDSVMPRTRTIAKNLFENKIQNETPKLEGETSFEEMRSLWQDGLRGIDAVLSFAKTLSPEMPFNQFWEDVGRADISDADLIQKFDQFISKLESATYDNEAYDLLSYRFYPGFTSRENLRERFPDVETTVKKILEKYEN